MEYKIKSKKTRKVNSTHLFAINELRNFFKSFSLNFFNLSIKERCIDITSIINKLEYPFDISSEFRKEINLIAENSIIEFLIILFSNKNIHYNDNNELILILFNAKSNRRCCRPGLERLERQLINILLHKNSNFYMNNENVVNNIFSDDEYIKNFVNNLTNTPTESIITMLSTRIRYFEIYTNKIKIEWLSNLSIGTVYDVIKGSYIYIRLNITKTNKIQKMINIIDYLFDTYKLENIPIDVIIKCFFETDDGIFKEELNKTNLNTKIFKTQIYKLISRIEQIAEFQKFWKLFCMLINTTCIDNIHILLNEIPLNWITRSFLESINYARYNTILFDSLIMFFPEFRFVLSDIYEIVIVQEKIKEYTPKSIIIKTFSNFFNLLDKLLILTPLNILNKILEFEWYEVLTFLSEKFINGNIMILCSTQEAIKTIDTIKNITNKNMFSFIKEITFKEHNIKFIDVNLFQIINNLFEINYCPRDISNYVNLLVHI